MPLHSQVGQVRVDLLRPHRAWMFLPMKEDEALHPLDVAVFRADAVVPRPERRAHAVEELSPFHRWSRGSLGAQAMSNVLHPVAKSLRAGAAFIDPRAHVLREFGVAHRRGRTAIARIPTPLHQRSLEVIDDAVKTLSAIAQRIFHLPAQLPR